MGRPFTDRWGVPVQAASEQGVVLLDEAIEALADVCAGAAMDRPYPVVRLTWSTGRVFRREGCRGSGCRPLPGPASRR
jgi:hypothetical protein